MSVLLESVVFLMLLGSDPAAEGSQAARCATIVEDGARLTCYDALFRSSSADTDMAAAPAATSAAATEPSQAARAIVAAPAAAPPPERPATASPGGAAAAAEADFGMTEAQRRAARGEPGPAVPERIRSRVTAVRRTPEGRAVVELENGQVWRQVETESRFLPVVGGEMTIRRASMGSFLATTSEGGPASRVHRVR